MSRSFKQEAAALRPVLETFARAEGVIIKALPTALLRSVKLVGPGSGHALKCPIRTKRPDPAAGGARVTIEQPGRKPSEAQIRKYTQSALRRLFDELSRTGGAKICRRNVSSGYLGDVMCMTLSDQMTGAVALRPIVRRAGRAAAASAATSARFTGEYEVAGIVFYAPFKAPHPHGGAGEIEFEPPLPEPAATIEVLCSSAAYKGVGRLLLGYALWDLYKRARGAAQRYAAVHLTVSHSSGDAARRLEAAKTAAARKSIGDAYLRGARTEGSFRLYEAFGFRERKAVHADERRERFVSSSDRIPVLNMVLDGERWAALPATLRRQLPVSADLLELCGKKQTCM